MVWAYWGGLLDDLVLDRVIDGIDRAPGRGALLRLFTNGPDRLLQRIKGFRRPFGIGQRFELVDLFDHLGMHGQRLGIFDNTLEVQVIPCPRQSVLDWLEVERGR